MKKKSSVSLWILITISFLILIGGLSVYLQSRSGSSENTADVRSRSTTLTDVGFDTPVTFQATCSEAEYVSYLDIVKNTFTECNQLFDQYHEYEGVYNIYTLNHEAFNNPVTVDPKIIDCIKISMDTAKISNKLDIAQGKLLALWHDMRESDNPTLPDDADIQAAIDHIGVSGIEVDGNTISFSDDSISLDLGAVAKGYTAGLAAQELEQAGLDNGFINAGGNVVLIGTKRDGSEWKVGIQNPDSNQSLVRYTTSTPTCLVTSGDYQRYVLIDGVRYSHIIDPDTGYPADYVRSVTVINPDSGFADAMSTALFCMSVEDGMEICKEQNLEALWFADKGTVNLTPNLSTDTFDIYYTPGLEGSIALTE